MEIKRDIYLNRLIARKHNGLIKVVTGLRRAGKSYLLFRLFRNHLMRSGIDEKHIVSVALDDRDNRALRNPDAMLSWLRERASGPGMYYLLLDEVQLLDEFEEVLNSLLHWENVDVYVTGSNSRFLSSDVITEFRGRGDEVRIHPLNFREFTSVHDGTTDEAWDDYFQYGGLPLTVSYVDPADKAEYLSQLLKNVYLSDIIERHRVRNEAELGELMDILSSSAGSLTNPLKLSKTFKSVKGKNISDKTLKNYIDYMSDAFLIEKAQRFDIKGKRYINSLAKYYFEDVGLRNARLNFRQTEENHIMENVIYNELRTRGYRVDVGIVDSYDRERDGATARKRFEVDFIATLGSEKYYIQSAFSIRGAEKLQQEQASLVRIGDSFKKIIVVRENIRPRRNEEGITTLGLYNFLLDGSSLNL